MTLSKNDIDDLLTANNPYHASLTDMVWFIPMNNKNLKLIYRESSVLSNPIKCYIKCLILYISRSPSPTVIYHSITIDGACSEVEGRSNAFNGHNLSRSRRWRSSRIDKLSPWALQACASIQAILVLTISWLVYLLHNGTITNQTGSVIHYLYIGQRCRIWTTRTHIQTVLCRLQCAMAHI